METIQILMETKDILYAAIAGGFIGLVLSIIDYNLIHIKKKNGNN